MAKVKVCLLFSKSVKGLNFVKTPYRVMALGQSVALVMVNKYMKFYKIILNSIQVMAKCDGKSVTDRRMDRQTDDGEVIPKCHICLQQVTQK